jgi:hypothetical protein
LDTIRQKKGSNVYYVPKIAVKVDTDLQLSDTDKETLNRFQESINDENKIVIDAYNSAKKKLVNTNDKSDLKVVEELSPEQVLSK